MNVDELTAFEWDNISVIGKGGSSTVYKAVLKPLGEHIAVKQIDTEGMTKVQVNGIKGEIETMRTFCHPNIVSYIGMQEKPNRVFILLEFADHGSLRQQYQRTGPLSELQVSLCLRQILLGLLYLHSNNIAHRDIKCANCLISASGAIKLADFGASKRIESESIVSGLKGTPHWMAPEVIKGTQMTTGWIKADVWSLGCTVVELFTGRVPYAEYDNPMTAMYKIASGEIPALTQRRTVPGGRVLSTEEMVAVDAEFPPSETLLDFVRLCCAVDPEARPTVEMLLEHPFVAQVLPEEVQQSFVDLVRLSTVKEMPLNTGSSGNSDHSDMFRPAPRSAAVGSSVDTLNNNLSSHNNRGEHQRLRNFHQSGLALDSKAGDGEEDEEVYEDDDWSEDGEPGDRGPGETDDAASSVELMPPPSRCQTQQTGHQTIGFSIERPEVVRRFSHNNRQEGGDAPEEQSFGDLPTPCMFGGQGRGLARYASETDLATVNNVNEHSRLEAINSFRVPVDLAESTDGDGTMSSSVEEGETGLDADLVYGQAQVVYQSMIDKYMSPRGEGNRETRFEVDAMEEEKEDVEDVVPVPNGLTSGAIKPNLSPVLIGGNKRSVVTETPPKQQQQQQQAHSPTSQSPAVLQVSAPPSATSSKFGYNPQVIAAGSHQQQSAQQSNGANRVNRNSSHLVAPKTVPHHAPDSVAPVSSGNKSGPVSSASRPNAPLSGEKLRIHTGMDDLAPPGGAQSDELRPGGGASSQMLDKLARSGAGAVRKKAASDLRDAQTKTDIRQPQRVDKQSAVIKIKSSAVHSAQQGKVTNTANSTVSNNKQPTKRSRTERLSQMMAAHNDSAVDPQLGSSLTHQYRSQHSQQGHQQQEVSARSRSAGVTMSYEGGRDARHRLPPVSGLRADNSYCNNNEDSENDEGVSMGKGSTPVRYIQTAPAVSRSVNLPPIKETASSQTPKPKATGRLNAGGGAGRLLLRPSAPLASMHTSTSSVDLLPLHRVQEE